ncbi:MAG: adenylosuccinate synthetase [Candidatus Saccharibacteria bacterium]|nr:adenylosuccinate synthetase [Candidatus Saccharibacteria bacterium]
MTSKAYVITDLGPGDGGKGGVVEAISAKVRPHTIIKEGGAQGSHGVVLADGRKFCFSQWGCGTFQNVPTYLSSRFVMHPTGLLNEAYALRDEFGISNAFDLLSVSPDCICASPYHQIWSRLYELSLRDHPHGTVGTGVGKAYRQSRSNPELSLFARDLTDKGRITLLLRRQREFVKDIFGELCDDDVLEADIALLHRYLADLDNEDVFELIVETIHGVGQLLTLKDCHSVLHDNEGCVVIERSHGVLTDSECGFGPHVSSLRTLPQFSREALRAADFNGKIVNLGVHRAYEIRHGAGPIPTACNSALNMLLPDSHKSINRWQGEVRVGALDGILLKYAIDQCNEGSTRLDGLCITWFDQIIQNGIWQVCTAYAVDGNLVLPGVKPNLSLLNAAIPVLKGYDLATSVSDVNNRDKVLDFCREIFTTITNVPVRLLSFGACRKDKYFK